jgi:hypothetical protein
VKKLFGSLIVAVLTVAPNGFGQGMPSDGGASARLARVFGLDRAFTATAVMTMNSGAKKGKGAQVMEMEYAVLAGKVRTEIDMSKLSMDGGEETRQQIAAMGMSQVVTIARPDLKKTYMIYPGLQAYCEIAQTDAVPNPDKMPKIEKQEMGRETLDGHPCVKQQVTVTEEGGKSFTALMWEATDLNGFPIQTVMKTSDGDVTTRFKNIKNEKPAAALFEPPAGFKRHGSMQEMMMGAMRQNMQGRFR